MELKIGRQMRLAAGLAIGLAVASVAPTPFAQEAIPGQATVAPASSAPLSKSQMKEQRKQQKAQEKAASEAAKAQKDSANALKHQNKAVDQQEKAA